MFKVSSCIPAPFFAFFAFFLQLTETRSIKYNNGIIIINKQVSKINPIVEYQENR